MTKKYLIIPTHINSYTCVLVHIFIYILGVIDFLI